MTGENPGIGRHIARGAGWMVSLKWLERILAFIRTIILARLLLPADFGLVALALMILALVEAVTKLRPDFALIQNTRAERRHYDTVWTLTVIRGAFMAVVLALVAGYCARFFEDPRLETIIYVIAVVIFAEGFQNVGIVDFFKDLRFEKVFIIDLASRFGSFVIAVTVALIWRNYWALVAGFASVRPIRIILSYLMHSYRPRFSLEAWREIFNFSKWLLLHGIFFNLKQRTDIFIIGKWLGPTTLGYYDIAKTVSELAGADMVATLKNVSFPAYAKIADDRARLRQVVIESFAVIFTIGAPIAIMTGLVSDPFVRVFLGSNWVEAIPLIKILVVYAVIHMCSATCSATLLALGKTRTVAMAQIIGAIVAVPLIFLGMQYWGVHGAAWAFVISGAFTTWYVVMFALKEIECPIAMVMRPIRRTLASLALMAAAVLLADQVFIHADSIFELSVGLVVRAFVGVSVYVAGHMALWWLAGTPDGPERHIMSIILPRLGLRA